MGTRFLIDTNVVIDFFRDSLPNPNADWLEQVIATPDGAISVITQIELFASPSIETA